ncbi:MAG: hypothetical protein HC877_06520 [Thioploca sp.]|nr:hypothetical protein [Thioploca sp.]
MTTKEKRLLRIALVIFMGYMLPFQLIPTVLKIYRDYRAAIENLSEQIVREIDLGERAEYWEAENKKAKQEQEKIEVGLLAGRTRELVGARMQGLIKQLAQEAGITFRTLEPPDTAFNSGEWVLVIQSMQFEANSETLMAFLQALEKAKENLKVVSLEVRSYRDRLNGTIKVTGFSQISTPVESKPEEIPPPPNPAEQSVSPPQPNEAEPSSPAPPSNLPTPSLQQPEQLINTPPAPEIPSQSEDLSLSPEEVMLLEEEDLSSIPPEEAIPPEEVNHE